MAVTDYVDLTLDFYDGQGNALTSGNAIFTPSTQLTDVVDHEIITLAPVTASFSGSGNPVVKLLPTDNANIQPSDWAWKVTFNNVPGNPPSFAFELPFSAGSSQFLSAQTPVSPDDPFTSILQGAYPGDSSLFLNGAGQWVVPAGAVGSAPVSSVNSKTGAVVLTASDVGAVAAGSQSVDSVNGQTGTVTLTADDVGGAVMRASTGAPGFTLESTGTAAITTWTAPSDSNFHRLIARVNLKVTTTLAGGRVIVQYTLPDGTAASQQLFAAGQAAGQYAADCSLFIESGSTVTIQQNSKLTAGAGVAWADLWEYK